jgi:hypothetical protein
MREGEYPFNSKDHLDRALAITNSILTAVSIVLTAIDIIIMTLPH